MTVPEGGESSSVGGMDDRQILQVFVENRLAVVGLFVIVFFILFCFVGPTLYHTNQTNAETALNATLNGPPDGSHLLGTDENGFDILGRLMFAGQASLIVGFASAFVATFFGTLYGAIAGFFGSWFDALLMRVVDVFLSIPVLFLLVALVTIYHAVGDPAHPGDRLRELARTGSSDPRGDPVPAGREYVQAVRVMGGNRTRIIGRHIIPNSIGTIVVFATFQIADSILLLAALGFIGLGVPAPQTDWGTMLSNGVDAGPAGTGGRSTRPVSASSSSWWPSTMWAMPCAIRWRSGCNSADRSRVSVGARLGARQARPVSAPESDRQRNARSRNRSWVAPVGRRLPGRPDSGFGNDTRMVDRWRRAAPLARLLADGLWIVATSLRLGDGIEQPAV